MADIENQQDERPANQSWLNKYDLAALRAKPVSTLTAMAGTYFGTTGLLTGALNLGDNTSAGTVVIQLFIATLAIPLYRASNLLTEHTGKLQSPAPRRNRRGRL